MELQINNMFEKSVSETDHLFISSHYGGYIMICGYNVKQSFLLILLGFLSIISILPAVAQYGTRSICHDTLWLHLAIVPFDANCDLCAC